MAEQLTIDRLFNAPSLAGPAAVGLKISPDGSRVTYLQGTPANKDRLNLWEYGLREGRARILIDSAALAPSPQALSDEELGRRERQRTAALSGIVEYSLAQSGRAVLFPLDGMLFYCELGTGATHSIVRIGSSPESVTDATISPDARHLAYVRGQNLYCYELAAAREKALTSDGGGAVKNGMAEFIAQEEMDRNTGYWWAPDGRHIAFVRVDETPVKLVPRFEIAADNIATYQQRYPSAGAANVNVRLGVVDIGNGTTAWIDLGPDADIYLARVDWLPGGKTIAVQRESRNQRRLDLMFADIETGNARLILTEATDAWVELHHELTFLARTPEFVWVSAREGFQHLYLYGNAGQLKRQLTSGRWNVDDFRTRAIKAIDEENRLIYFTATEKTPVERHLYRTSLDTCDPRTISRISREDGLHGIVMSRDAKVYVDTFSSAEQPPQVSLHEADGRRLAFLIENRLDHGHPDAPYAGDNSVPQYGTIAAADGQSLHYRLFTPHNFDPAIRYPAIVDVYGGPGVQRVVNSWCGASFTQILTRAGYVVFQLDNRGTAFRGTGFQASIRGKLGDVEVTDQVQGARWLASQSFVDAASIGVWGWSYGGYLTLMLMFKAPGVFRAGIAGAPVTDWSLYDTHYTERFLGRPQDNPEAYAASSVLPYAEGLRGDLLVMHGMADDNVLFLHSTKLFRRLQDLNRSFDIMVYPGAKHGLLRQADGRHAYTAIKNFFDDSLKR